MPARGLSLLVVIPCLDEENTVGRIVANVPQDIEGVGSVEIVVIAVSIAPRVPAVMLECPTLIPGTSGS